MFINKIEEYAETHSKIAGFLATIIGIISFLPVLYIVYKTKKTINFPYRTLILALLSNLLWIYYSVAKYPKIDFQIAFMGSLYFFIYLFILHTKAFY
jgi:uncharacterized protein with PQ loop repeat